MSLCKRIRLKISVILLGICLAGWLVLLLTPSEFGLMYHSHLTMTPTIESSDLSTIRLCGTNDLNEPTRFSGFKSGKNLLNLTLGWFLMLLAMMLPKMIIPVRFICSRSLAKNRFWCSTLLLGGYLMIWMMAGIILSGLVILLNQTGSANLLLISLLLIVVFVYQGSPVKQVCLNHSHHHHVVAAFGLEAFKDSFRMGVTHGLWCVGAGWALMLLPLLLPVNHFLTMLLITLIMLSEHFRQPDRPKWGFKKRFNIVSAVGSYMLQPINRRLYLKLKTKGHTG